MPLFKEGAEAETQLPTDGGEYQLSRLTTTTPRWGICCKAHPLKNMEL